MEMKKEVVTMERKTFRNLKAWKDVLQWAMEEFKELAELENAKLPEDYLPKVGDELPVGMVLEEISEVLGNDVIPDLENLINEEWKARVLKKAGKDRA